MDAPTSMSLIGVLVLALVHIVAPAVNRNAEKRPRWLAAASGMAVAYVFIHLLPELGDEQADWLDARADRRMQWLENQVYIAAFIGLILALAFDRAAPRERAKFWARTTSFGVYNALIGTFALHERSVPALVLGTIAFGAHLMSHDRSLYLRFPDRYERIGRWVLAASVIAGWLLATVWTPPTLATAVVLGLISGGIIMNVIKEELPGHDEGPFAPWVAGALSFMGLLLALEYTANG